MNHIKYKRDFRFVLTHSVIALRGKMIYFIFACLIVLDNVRGESGNATMDTSGNNSDSDIGRSKPEKIFSNIIRISNKEPTEKYDTISYSQKEPDSRASSATQPESKIFILENGKTYEVGQESFQSSNPYLNAAIGAVSAHLISHAHQEYIPYPPNGNPQDYPPYQGRYHVQSSPLSGAYERANRAGYGFYHSTPERQNFDNYRPNSCYPNYYSDDVESIERDEGSYGRRFRKEPIKRHLLRRAISPRSG